MHFLQNLYRDGMTAKELLSQIRWTFKINNGEVKMTVRDYVEQLRHLQSDITRKFAIRSAHNTDADKLYYEQEMADCDRAIDRVDNLALDELNRMLLDGVYYGIGYKSIDSEPCPGSPHINFT